MGESIDEAIDDRLGGYVLTRKPLAADELINLCSEYAVRADSFDCALPRDDRSKTSLERKIPRLVHERPEGTGLQALRHGRKGLEARANVVAKDFAQMFIGGCFHRG